MPPHFRTVAVISALAAFTVPGHVQTPDADLIIVNAKVFTGVPATPWAEALSVIGDRIGVVGTTAAVRKVAGSSTRVIDAAGKIVVPGINDAHVHIGEEPPGTRLEGPPAIQQDPSLEEILTRLKAAVAKAPKGGWIYGEIGARVIDDPKATRQILDGVAPDHPVMLTAWTGHGTLFSTTALRRLNVRDDEPDPPGGFFARTPGTKTITGLAHEYAEYMLRQRLSMMPDEQAQRKMIERYAAEAVAFGITSVQVMATNRPAADLARCAIAANLPIRMRVIDFPLTAMSAWRRAARASVRSAGLVTISGVKWIIDGTPVERLMLLREPYSDKPATRGRQNYTPGELSAFLKLALAQQEQPMIHAVGDAAIDAVLGALEQSGGDAWQPLRPRIEHGDMLEPGQFERAKRFGVMVVQNPSHFMIPEVMGQRLGARKARVTMMKSLIAAGVAVAIGSDGPMNPYLNVMFATINANNPPEAMTREQAIAAYTLGSARAERLETQKGTISPGMLADIAVLSQDIFTVKPDALPATVSVLTLVGGKIVHEERR